MTSRFYIHLTSSTSLASICIITAGLLEDRSPYYGSMPFSASYQLSNGTVSIGSLSDSQRTHIHTQLSNIAIKTVDISISSATIISPTQSKHTLVRRQTSSQQILQLNGIVHAREGCLRKCLVDFVKQFKSSLCTISLTLTQ
ncbi:hypothetical protein I4U23_001886 [Adineta vaga]|nr:hypothetical protein I4U23_001886 [Adineta vaga]